MDLNNSRNLYVRRQACRGENHQPNSCGSSKISAQGECRWGRALLACVILVLVPGFAAAQGNVVSPRISAQVDESRVTELRGNMHALARPQNDQGKVDPSFRLERITMMFQPTAAQQTDLDVLLAAQQNPTSPSFHKWLTPEQYADRYGIAQSDLDKVTVWLQAQGFAVVEVPRSRNWIVFNGTAAQVESALHSEVHNYTANGRKFYANSGEPSVPAALAVVVLGFRGLNNFPVKPRALKSFGSSVQPNFTSGATGNHFVTPGDFATIYDLKPLYNASTAIDGTGQKIVIVGQSNVVLSDIAAFRTAAGLPAKVPTIVLVPGSTDPGVVNTGDDLESSIDIEWAGAIAKNATITLVYSGNGVFDAWAYAIAQNFAPVISNSYGGCEPTFSASDVSSLAALAQQANSQGITIVSAVGDGGGTDCDGDVGNYPAVLGLNVDFPGSMPYVTGVGGSEFNEGGLNTYWQPTTVPPPNGTDIVSSALSYIPEMVWNDTSSANGLSAGGGGASSVFGKPSWQTGTGVPADGVRDVPDISVNGSSGHDPYLVCAQFIPVGGTTYTSSCLNGTYRYTPDNELLTVGGTSFGAPTFAGMLALVNQKTGSTGQGNINYILYPLASSSPAAFHDITTGNNMSPCTLGTESCPNGGSIGFNATTGYDLATGLGSIDAAILVNAWPTGSSSAPPAPVLSSISPMSITAGSGDFTLTATGSSFATQAQILWNGSTAGVTMQSGGTSTSIKATISHNLVAYGTTASVTVTDDAAKAREASAAQTFTVNASGAPLNDNIANAIAVTTSSFTSAVDNSAATTESTDPTPPCVTGSSNARTKTVWWSLTAGSSGSVLITTIDSVYNTTLSVWTGSPGSLTNVACNDDISVAPALTYVQSSLSFAAVAGTKYYILVAPFGPSDLGGQTVLNVSNANPSPLSASPSSRTVAAGSPATFTITNADVVSYALTCSPLPTGVACPAVSVPANSTASLVITTTLRTSSLPPLMPKGRIRLNLWPEALTILGISILTLLTVGRRRVLALIPASALALLLVLLAAGCGGSYGGSGGKPNPYGTPAGSYSITVTGTSGGTTQTTTVTLNVT